MGEIKLAIDSPEYAIISGLKRRLQLITTVAERAAAGSSPASKEGSLARSILEIATEGIPYSGRRNATRQRNSPKKTEAAKTPQ